MAAAAKLFFSYAREDKRIIEKYYKKLSDAGFDPWMDTKRILAGERWRKKIEKSLKASDFVLIFLSRHSDKDGFIQREIKMALDLEREKRPGRIYIIPVKLDNTQISEEISEYQWVDLTESDGWGKLLNGIQEGMQQNKIKGFSDIILDRVSTPKGWNSATEMSLLSQEKLFMIKIRKNDEEHKYLFTLDLQTKTFLENEISVWQINSQKGDKCILRTNLRGNKRSQTLSFLPEPPFEIRANSNRRATK